MLNLIIIPIAAVYGLEFGDFPVPIVEFILLHWKNWLEYSVNVGIGFAVLFSRTLFNGNDVLAELW